MLRLFQIVVLQVLSLIKTKDSDIVKNLRVDYVSFILVELLLCLSLSTKLVPFLNFESEVSVALLIIHQSHGHINLIKHLRNLELRLMIRRV